MKAFIPNGDTGENIICVADTFQDISSIITDRFEMQPNYALASLNNPPRTSLGVRMYFAPTVQNGALPAFCRVSWGLGALLTGSPYWDYAMRLYQNDPWMFRPYTAYVKAQASRNFKMTIKPAVAGVLSLVYGNYLTA